MNMQKLKIVAGAIIVESELSKSSKLQLLNWLQNEATEIQVKSFLLDGEILKLDEQAIEIVNDRFSVAYKNQTLYEQVITALVLGMIYRKFLSKASRTCKAVKGKEKSECIKKFRIQAMKAQMTALQQGYSRCSQHKHPEDCKNKTANKMKSIKAKLDKM